MEPAKSLPVGWNILLVVLLGIGVSLVCLNPAFSPGVASFVPEVQAKHIATFLGIFLISIPISHWIVFYMIQGIDQLFDLVGEATVEDLWPSSLVGVFEGILYPLSFIIGQGEFVGLWLAVKVAGQWVRWGTEYPAPEGEDDLIELRITEAKRGRRRFNKFLIGNTARIILAGITYMFLRLTLDVDFIAQSP